MYARPNYYYYYCVDCKPRRRLIGKRTKRRIKKRKKCANIYIINESFLEIYIEVTTRYIYIYIYDVIVRYNCLNPRIKKVPSVMYRIVTLSHMRARMHERANVFSRDTCACSRAYKSKGTHTRLSLIANCTPSRRRGCLLEESLIRC